MLIVFIFLYKDFDDGGHDDDDSPNNLLPFSKLDYAPLIKVFYIYIFLALMMILMLMMV